MKHVGWNKEVSVNGRSRQPSRPFGMSAMSHQPSRPVCVVATVAQQATVLRDTIRERLFEHLRAEGVRSEVSLL